MLQTNIYYKELQQDDTINQQRNTFNLEVLTCPFPQTFKSLLSIKNSFKLNFFQLFFVTKFSMLLQLGSFDFSGTGSIFKILILRLSDFLLKRQVRFYLRYQHLKYLRPLSNCQCLMKNSFLKTLPAILQCRVYFLQFPRYIAQCDALIC